MGHVAESTLRKMAGAGHLKGLELGEEVLPPCKACLLGKMKHQPYKESLTPEGNPRALRHRGCAGAHGLVGTSRTPTMGGKCIYVLSLLDDCTRYVWSILLPSKESKGVAQALEAWRVKAERESGRQLKVLRSDGGMEFQGEVATWAAKLGVTRQLTAPYSPQQNGRVERWHRTMAESIRAMLLHSGAPVSLWGEALGYSVWVKRRTAHTALGGRTPYKAWTGKEADLSMARVWGCVGCILLPEPEKRAQGKLGQRGLMGVCVGVDTESKAWRMLDLTSVRVKVTRNVEFLEHVTLAEWQMGETWG